MNRAFRSPSAKAVFGKTHLRRFLMEFFKVLKEVSKVIAVILAVAEAYEKASSKKEPFSNLMKH